MGGFAKILGKYPIKIILWGLNQLKKFDSKLLVMLFLIVCYEA